MSSYNPSVLAERLGAGLLSFPVTTFDENLELDEQRYRDHLAWLSSYDVAGLFAAGGTGEFFSLSTDEVGRVVRMAVDEAHGRVPIIAPAGRSTREAIHLAALAEEAGADGLLLLPHYLTEASQEGLFQHIGAVLSSTRLPVIVYGRANMVPSPTTVARLADAYPNLVGYKDGIGDIEFMTRLVSELGDRLLYVGGLPTAETFALPLLELGVKTYSSALFNFLPEFALGFYDDVRRRDHESVRAKLREVVLPYTAIRDREKGYAVSIVKAGLDAIGHSGGPVRPPLSALQPAEFAELTALLASTSATV